MRTATRSMMRIAGGVIMIVLLLAGYNVLRHLVFLAPTEDVVFTSADGTELRGTLVKPWAGGPHPAVVMMHGSGSEHRGGPSYRIMANAILRTGIAVLLYDKRGVGESGGVFGRTDYRSFIADGAAAVRFLAARDDVDSTRIGLHVNSESGWFAPEIAQSTGQVAWIFNRAGPPLPWMQNVIWEVRNDMLAAGIAESDVGPLLDVTLRRWKYYVAAAADPSLATSPERDAINAEMQRLRDTVPGADGQLPAEVAPYDPDRYAALAAEVGYDQTPFLEAIDVPMIYTFGERDINVPTAESVAYLETFRERHGKDIEIVVLEGVGHSFANWTGLFYGGYVPEFIAVLDRWYRDRAASPASPSP